MAVEFASAELRKYATTRARIAVGKLENVQIRALNLEPHVLEEVNAVHHEGDLVHWKRELGVRIRRDLDGPVVGAEEHRVPPREPLRRGDAESGTALHVAGVVLRPERAPAGVDQYGVARG